MCKKQQTTERGFTWYHITSHTCSTSASGEKLNAGLSLWVIFWGYLFSVRVVCVHFILIIKLFLSVYCLNLCRATFAVWINKRTSLASRRSYCVIKRLMLCIKLTIIFIKIQNTNTLDVKTCPQSCWLFVVEQVMKQAVWSVISSRRTRLQLGVRASAVTVETRLQSGRFTRELHRFNV